MRFVEVLIRALTAADLPVLATFRCSNGEPYEDVVGRQMRDPLPLRYLASPPRFDGRMLIGTDSEGRILVVGAHHIEPTLVPDSATRKSSLSPLRPAEFWSGAHRNERSPWVS